MKTKYLIPAVLLAAAVAGSTALAQDNSGAASTPANAQVAAPTPVNGVVYVEKLPTATQLTKDAESEGLSIVRIDQSAERVLVVYKYPNGTARTFAYTTSEGGTAAPTMTQAAAPATSAASYTVVSAPQQSPNTVVYASPAPTVIYTNPAPVYYAPGYATYYDPAWDFWAPLAIGVGLGWGFHGGGYYHGGYHGGGWHGGGHGWHH
jgi:hypothetical protein